MSRVRSRAVALLLAVALGAPAPARAGAAPRSEDAFRERWRFARTLYDHGYYAAAVEELRAAYNLKPLPMVLFNLGQAHDKLGHRKEALDYFERYRAAEPAPDDATRARLDEYLLRLRAEARVSSRRWLILPLTVGAVAIAAGVAGTLVGALGVDPEFNQLLQTVRTSCTRGTPCTGSEPFWDRLEERRRVLATRATTAYALWGIAGAVLAADVVLWIVAARGREAPHHVWLAPTFGTDPIGGAPVFGLLGGGRL